VVLEQAVETRLEPAISMILRTIRNIRYTGGFVTLRTIVRLIQEIKTPGRGIGTVHTNKTYMLMIAARIILEICGCEICSLTLRIGG
jgi:hypothetical protein